MKSASIREAMRAAMMAMGMIDKNLPIIPSIMRRGTKATIVVDTVPRTGTATSVTPAMAAWIAGSPRDMCA